MTDTVISFTTVEYPDEAAMNKARDIFSAELGPLPTFWPGSMTTRTTSSCSRTMRLPPPYAPRLFAAAEAGDIIAGGIVTHAVRDLEYVMTAIEDGASPPLFLCGGDGERFIPLVGKAFRDRTAHPSVDGLSGALLMARELHETGHGSAVNGAADSGSDIEMIRQTL